MNETLKRKIVFDGVDIMDIAKSIAKLHYDMTDGEKISKIKMHKSIFIMYTHWIKFSTGMESSELEKEPIERFGNTILFNVEFTAWAYGPIVKEVYTRSEEYENLDLDKIKDLYELIDADQTLIEFIKHTYGLIMNTRDFGLVDYTQDSNSWKKARSLGKQTIIKDDWIFEEYKAN